MTKKKEAGCSALDERLTLLESGYEPLPACGKAIYATGWTKATITEDWLRETRPDDENTGLRCGRLVAVDIDVWDSETVEAIKEVIREYFEEGEPWCERVGAKGAAILFRVEGDELFAGLAVRATPNSEALLKRLNASKKGEQKLKDVEKVEFLGKSRQVIAYGVHPDTRKEYQWASENHPEFIPFKDLPSISVKGLKGLARGIAEAMEEHGYVKPVVTGGELIPLEIRKSQCSGEPVTPDQIEERLRLISNNWEWLEGEQDKNGRDLWVAVGGGIISANVRTEEGDEDGDWDAALAVHEFSTGGYSHDGTPPGKYVDEDDVEGMLRTLTPKANGAQAGFGTLDHLARAAAKHNGVSLGKAGLTPNGEDVFAGVEHKGAKGDDEAESEEDAALNQLLSAILACGDEGDPPSYDIAEDLDLPKREWIWDNRLSKGLPIVCHGDSGLGKTELFASLAVGCAKAAALEAKARESGQNFPPDTVEWHSARLAPMRFLIIGAEDDYRDFWPRLDKICAEFGITRKDIRGMIEVWYVPGGEHIISIDKGIITPHPWLKKLHDKIQEVQPDFVLFDTVIDFFNFDFNVDNQSIAAFGKKFLTGLCRYYGITVGATAHPSKAAMYTGQGYAGGTQWKGGFRQVWFFELPEGAKADSSNERILRWKANYMPRDTVRMFQDKAGRLLSSRDWSAVAENSALIDTILNTIEELRANEIYIVDGPGGRGQRAKELAAELKDRDVDVDARKVSDLLLEAERDLKAHYLSKDDAPNEKAGWRSGPYPDGYTGLMMGQIKAVAAKKGRKGGRRSARNRRAQ